MARKVVYERYPLVFYEEDKELYEALKRTTKGNRGSLRATILNALEAHLGDAVQYNTENTEITIDTDNTSMGDW